MKPYTPQNAAGRMIEPLVWLPSASGTIPAATAAADPLDEPPGVCSGLCGLRVLPGEKYAHSVVTVLPMITAPAARSMRPTVASRAGVRPACKTVPSSVGMSPVSMMSLMPTGTPCSGPGGVPSRRSRSRAARLRERMLGIEELPRLHLGLDLAHAREAGLDQLLGADRAVADRARGVGRPRTSSAGSRPWPQLP